MTINLYDYAGGKVGFDIGKLEDVLRIRIEVVTGDEIMEVLYKNMDYKIFDSDTNDRFVDYLDSEYVVYSDGDSMDTFERWCKRSDSYDYSWIRKKE